MDNFSDLRDGNARLIAELLEALFVAVKTWERFYPLLPVREDVEDAEFVEINKARAAVCKALGKQPWEFHNLNSFSFISN